MGESNESMSVRRIEVFVCETAPRSGAPSDSSAFFSPTIPPRDQIRTGTESQSA